MSARSKLFWLVSWAIAFGMVEGAVVTYLRRLSYPGAALDGPIFPLRIATPAVLATEVVREAATLVMLGAVAMLAERRPERRFAAFALCFGLWDLSYYAFLKAAIGWPHGPLEWDILFLIPGPWAAPVLAPVLVSAAIIAGALLILVRADETQVLRPATGSCSAPAAFRSSPRSSGTRIPARKRPTATRGGCSSRAFSPASRGSRRPGGAAGRAAPGTALKSGSSGSSAAKAPESRKPGPRRPGRWLTGHPWKRTRQSASAPTGRERWGESLV